MSLAVIRARLRGWLLCLGLMAGALGATAAHAAEGEFAILSAHTYRLYSVYYLDADAAIRLNPTLRRALSNGVSLVVAYDIEVKRPRGWWFDDTVASLTQRYRLRYHALSRRYLVDNLNTGISHSFSRLAEAVDDIAALRQLPLIDRTLLEKGEHYAVDLRVRIDTGEYPLPLRVRAIIDGAWRPASEWYRCPLI